MFELTCPEGSPTADARGPTACDVAARLRYMTLHRGREEEVGVRALHDRLSEHLDRVEQGVDIVVTRRGRRVARLTAIDRDEALAELLRRVWCACPSDHAHAAARA